MIQKEQGCRWSHVGEKHRKVPVSSGNMEGLGGQGSPRCPWGGNSVGGRMNGRREVNVDGPGHREG